MGGVKKIVLLVIAVFLAYFTAFYFADVYHKLVENSATWTDVRGITGFSESYIFFLTLLFTAFGGKHKYWWLGLLLIPAVIFELYFDFSHLYFPLLLALLAWLLGFGISKLFANK